MQDTDQQYEVHSGQDIVVHQEGYLSGKRYDGQEVNAAIIHMCIQVIQARSVKMVSMVLQRVPRSCSWRVLGTSGGGDRGMTDRRSTLLTVLIHMYVDSRWVRMVSMVLHSAQMSCS
jgi:hypothetical protein